MENEITKEKLEKYFDLTSRALVEVKKNIIEGRETDAKEIIDIDVDPSTYDQIIVTQVVPSPYEQELDGIVEYRTVLGKHYPQDEPNYVSLEGFLNAKVLAEALFKNGPILTRETLGRTIESMDSVDVGIGKTISFGAMDHMGLEDIYYSRHITECRNGYEVVIRPACSLTF